MTSCLMQLTPFVSLNAERSEGKSDLVKPFHLKYVSTSELLTQRNFDKAFREVTKLRTIYLTLLSYKTWRPFKGSRSKFPPNLRSYPLTTKSWMQSNAGKSKNSLRISSTLVCFSQPTMNPILCCAPTQPITLLLCAMQWKLTPSWSI